METRQQQQQQLSSHFSVRLKKFDPEKIRPCSTILFAGPRRTGKSFLMRDIMYNLRKRVYDATVLTGTIDEDHLWTNHTPEPYVHFCQEDFPKDVLDHSLARQDRRKALASKLGVWCPPSMFVFEDLEYLTPTIWKQQGIKSLMLNGRWKKTFVLIAVQYLMSAKMELRGMFDYAFFCFENNQAVRERIYKQFANICPSFPEFELLFFDCTKNRRVMVVDCRANSYKLEDVIFWYKAKDRGSFKVGVPDVWKRTYAESDSEAQKERSRRLARLKKKHDSEYAAIELLDDEEEEEEQGGAKNKDNGAKSYARGEERRHDKKSRKKKYKDLEYEDGTDESDSV